VKLIVDAQLPPALAVMLRQQGLDAVAVREIGLREAKDAAIWQYALDHQAAIVSKDEDFAERCQVSRNAPVVIWLRMAMQPTRCCSAGSPPGCPCCNAAWPLVIV